MIKVHATKKLFAKLPLDDNGRLKTTRENREASYSGASPLGDWHANLLTLQKHNCILFIHDATRFPVFIKELLKPDFAQLSWHFEDVFMNTLLKAGANEKQMSAAANALGELEFDSVCDRSVQSTLTQRAKDIEHMLIYENMPLENASAYRTGVWLSETLTKAKGMKDYIRPNEQMFALLDELSSASKNGGENTAAEKKRQAGDSSALYDGFDNVISLDKFRK